MSKGTQVREVLQNQKFFVGLIFLLILYFALPFAFRYDRFPFSNYPMYASSYYSNPNLFFLCTSQGQRMGGFLYPTNQRMAAILSYRMAQKQGVPVGQSPYLREVQRKYEFVTGDSITKLRFVRYRLDLDRYKLALATDESRAQMMQSVEFNACLR